MLLTGHQIHALSSKLPLSPVWDPANPLWVAGAGVVGEILREAGSRLKGRFVWRDYRAGSLVEDIVMLHT